MTVIATDGKTMAGDSLTSSGSHLLATRQKVTRLKDGRIAGACGPTTDCIKLIRWLNEGGDDPKLSDDVAAIILNADGSVDWVDCKLEMVHGNLIPYAIGSGGEMALGAMLAGASPADAVALAMTRQVDCGGEITSMHIEQRLQVAS